MEDLFYTQVSKPVSILREKLPNIKMDYFYKIWVDFWNQKPQPEKPTVAIADAGVPEIYIRASGANPLYLFGGSYFTDKYTEEIFPQISDPVVKSVCSILLSNQFSNIQIAAVLMPVRSASARKALVYLRDVGYRVIPMEEEPFLSEHVSRQFISEQTDFLLELQAITQQPIKRKSLYTAADRITRAHKALQRLDSANLPALAKSFVQQTYYLTPDIENWIHAVETLVASDGTIHKKPSSLLLTGSPIYFPNMKIPLILQNLGITDYQNNCDVPFPVNYERTLNGGKTNGNAALEVLHKLHYETVRGDITHTFRMDEEACKNRKGVIYHLLKGQLMYAYEAEHLEKVCIREGIPFVCVETDYTDADTEQIRIRLEAFSELLQQEQPSETRIHF